MSNPILKKAGQSVGDSARKFAKQLGQEPAEMLKSAKTQIGGTVETDRDLVGQIIDSGDGKSEMSEIDKKNLESQRRNRIEELKKELEEMRLQRKKKEEEWLKTQEDEFKSDQRQKTLSNVLIEPTTKPKRGLLGFMKKKQGTKEMGKQISG